MANPPLFPTPTLNPSPNPDTPSKVFNWVKTKVLGAGSYGTVYLAINKDNNELLAVKSINCRWKTQEELDAIENEIRILQSLDSPHVVKFLGSDHTFIGRTSLTRNLLMEYVPGGSLFDRMHELGGKFDEDLVRIYTRGILQGLDYLHAQRIVHCDIKGKNILVGGETRRDIKIADFGSAIWLAPMPGLATCSSAKVNHFGGTRLWMAPEVLRKLDQTTASDIWSLGCTVLEMMTGNPPWMSCKSSNFRSVLSKICHTDEIPSFPPGISNEASDFLLHCLQRNPGSRASASELLFHPFIQQSIGVGISVIPNGGGNGYGYGGFLPASEPSSSKSILNPLAIGHSWASGNTLHNQQQGSCVQSEDSHAHPPKRCRRNTDETGCHQVDPARHICNIAEPILPLPPALNQSGADSK